ncbi:MAG: FGGY family carbohydrate kinase, partial [Bauldia litoralis]
MTTTGASRGARREAGTGILAIDQGTTSSRAIVFGLDASIVAVAQREYAQHYPRNGWVEHDPEDIWESTVAVCRAALAEAAAKGVDAACAGITNQRETTLVWDRATGEPLGNAIVWQDRRGAEACRRLIEAGAE